MMQELGPCGPASTWLHVFIVTINAFQAVAIAYIAQRTVRKNRQERNGNGHNSY